MLSLMLRPQLLPNHATADEGTEGELVDIDGQALTEQDIRLAEQNERAQQINGGPQDLPTFSRDKFSVKVIARSGYRRDTESDNRVIVKDYVVGDGPIPQDGQEVEFHYTAFVRVSFCYNHIHPLLEFPRCA